LQKRRFHGNFGKMGKAIKILVVDDHFFVRLGLKTLLNDHFQVVVFGEASNAQEALAHGCNEDWDVALVDIGTPGRWGFEVLKEFKMRKPKMPVLILSMHEEEQSVIRALKLGASSYIRIDSAGHELVKGIEAALRGCKYITPSIAEMLAILIEKDLDGRAPEALAEREFQVMRLLAAGKSMKEIDDELSLSVKTVNTDRTRLRGR
jgi:two-component system invasion response regulator UvrY